MILFVQSKKFKNPATKFDFIYLIESLWSDKTRQTIDKI